MKLLHYSLLVALAIVTGTTAFNIEKSVLSLLQRAKPLSLEYCKGLGYGKTGKINLLRQTNLTEVVEGYIFKALDALERTSCSKLTKNFACALLAPPSLKKFGSLPPCRSLCLEVEKSCADVLSFAAKFGLLKNGNCKATKSGKGYRGTTNKTRKGLTCQSWAEHKPHSHGHITAKTHPWEGLDNNYCRNPNNEAGGPWCYTTSKEVRWDYCDVPACDVNLRCNLLPVPAKNKGCINFQEESGGYKIVVEGTPRRSQVLDWLTGLK